MTDDTSESEEKKTRWYDVSWNPKDQAQELLKFLRSGDLPFSGVPLSQSFEEFKKLVIDDSYKCGLADPNGYAHWINDELFKTYVKQHFLDLLKNGTILAFGQHGASEWTPPPGYWNFVEVKDINFDLSMFFMSDPARKVHGVMIAPARIPAGATSGTDVGAPAHKPVLPTHRRYAKAEVRKWYIERVQTWPTTEAGPSRQQDEDAAKPIFPGISRTMIRDVRKELAPQAWKDTGKRQR